jgi:hypothetical protein
VSSITPNGGSLAAGGNLVTVNGTNFAPNSTARFVTPSTGTPTTTVAATVRYVSPTQLIVTPAAVLVTGTTYRVDVTTEGVTSADDSTYVPAEANTTDDEYVAAAAGTATIASISPQKVQVGDYITIVGTVFANTSQVYFTTSTGIANSAPVSPVIVNSTTQLVVQVPAGTVSGPIRVSNTIGISAPSAQSLIIAANATEMGSSIKPTVTSLSRSTGPIGSWLLINGTNFTASADVLFVTNTGTPQTVTASVLAASVFNVSDTQLRILVPAGLVVGTAYQVRVRTTEGGMSVETPTFTATTATPTITAVTPLKVQVGDPITITGTGFDAGSTVFFSGTNGFANGAATATISSITTLGTTIMGQVTVPSGATTGPIRHNTSAGVSTLPSGQRMVEVANAGDSIRPTNSSL